MIINLIDKKLELIKNDTKYQSESVIHDILFPRYTTSDQILYENHNLWIIDENLAYHHYAASNKTISDISTSNSEKIPDIIIFDDIDDNSIAKSISIIELKRPQRNNLDQSPIGQMLNIIPEIQNKKIKRENGRDIQVDESTRYNCFLICDINDSIKEDVNGRDLTNSKEIWDIMDIIKNTMPL
jgi:hypothetical protein